MFHTGEKRKSGDASNLVIFSGWMPRCRLEVTFWFDSDCNGSVLRQKAT